MYHNPDQRVVSPRRRSRLFQTSQWTPFRRAPTDVARLQREYLEFCGRHGLDPRFEAREHRPRRRSVDSRRSLSPQRSQSSGSEWSVMLADHLRERSPSASSRLNFSRSPSRSPSSSTRSSSGSRRRRRVRRRSSSSRSRRRS